MQVPLELSFRGVERSPELQELVRAQVHRLHRFAHDIISCRVAVERRQSHQETGSPFRVRVELKIAPGKTLVAKRRPGDHGPHDALPMIISSTFRALDRQLKKLAEQRRGDVKRHDEPRAVVVKLFAEQGYGFIGTPGGREVYFHRNAVVNGAWDELDIGSEVRYVQQMGEKGPQASTVHLVGRLGVTDAAVPIDLSRVDRDIRRARLTRSPVRPGTRLRRPGTSSGGPRPPA